MAPKTPILGCAINKLFEWVFAISLMVRKWRYTCCILFVTIMTSSNGNISVLPAFCAGNSPATDEFPAQRPMTWSCDVFFDLCLNQQLSNQWRRRWFETSWPSLWRHCNDKLDDGFASSMRCRYLSFGTNYNRGRRLLFLLAGGSPSVKNKPRFWFW